MGRYHLRILGPLELTRRDGVAVQSVMQQPKRAALLAFLAMSPTAARTRSELLDLFWRDSSEKDGRHALSQALYYLRRSLGSTALSVDGEMVRLRGEVIETDIACFRHHLEAGGFEDAAALVRGDLLEQFPSIPDFDQWLDGAREAVRQQTLSALDQLWTAAEGAGESAAAIRWAQHAAALSPYDEQPVRRLVRSLLSDGQPVRARDVLDRYADTFRRDLDLEPGDVGELWASISAETTSGRRESRETQHAAEMPVSEMPISTIAEPAIAAPAGAVGDASTSGRWGLRALLPTTALAAVFVAVSLGISVFQSDTQVSAASATNRVGIFPFFYSGSPDRAYLGDGIPELIGISIQSLDQVSMIDPRALGYAPDGQELTAPALADAAARARTLGAGHFLIGTVVEAGGHIQVTARLHRTSGDVVAVVSDRAAAEEHLFDLVDALARQLVASDAFPGTTDLERSAALTSSSLPALRHFFRGERLFRQGQYPDAVAAFDEAVQEDSTFALAMYRGAIAQLWSADADFAQARTKVVRALRHRDRVSALEANLFLALHEFLRGRLLEAERLYEAVLVRQPENIEAWFQLAETRFHYNALHGRSTSNAEEAWRHVLALNPDHHAALIHLSAITALNADPDLDSLEVRINGSGPAVFSTPQVRALKVFRSGTEAEKVEFLNQLSRHTGAAIASTAAYTARYLRDPAAGARIATVLTEPDRPAAERAEGHLLLAHLSAARGQLAAARRELEAARQFDPSQAELHELLLRTVPGIRTQTRNASDVTIAIPAGVPSPPHVSPQPAFDGSSDAAMFLYARALAYHRDGGEAGALVSAARQLASANTDSGSATLLNILALGLIAERDLTANPTADVREDLARALGLVERWYEHLRNSYIRSLARERFLLAEAEIARGRDETAESLLTPIGENSIAELPYLGLSLLRIAEIRERAGDRDGATVVYRRLLDLWAAADSEFDPIRREISGRVDLLQSAATP